MKIGIILHPYGESKPAGLGRYVYELTKNLLEHDKENEYIIYLKKRPKIMPDFGGNNYRVAILGFGRFWRELGFFFAPRADIYIFNTPVMPFIFRPKKSIVVVFDFAYRYIEAKNFKEAFNKYLLFKMNKSALKNSDIVVSISEFTKKEIIKFFSVKEEKVRVIYSGFSDICALPPQRVKIPEKFFLYVGVIKERKNLFNIVKGFNEFKKNNETNFKLAVIGKGGGGYHKKIMDFIKKSNLEKEVVFLDFINDSQLSCVYRNAYGLIFPSLIEGFGFTVLEAMSCGLPVVTSNRGAVAETAGGAALLVDPKNFKEIGEAMIKLSNNEDLRKNLIKKGLRRAKDFSWQRYASEFIRLFKNI